MEVTPIFFGNPAAQAQFAAKYKEFLEEWVELQEAVRLVMLNRTIFPPDMARLESLPDDDPLVIAAEDRFKADLSSFVLARTAVDDFSELLTLASNGYGIGALKTLRGMYERIVTSAYVALFPEVSRALIDSTWTHQWKVWRRATALRPALASTVDENEIEMLRERAEAAKARHNESFCKHCGQLVQVHAWTNVDLDTMAQKVDSRLAGPELNLARLSDFYLRCYLQPTALAHATGTSVNEKFENVDGQWTYKMDSSAELKQSLIFGHTLLLSLLAHQNRHFNYGLENILLPRNAALRRVWNLPPPDDTAMGQ
jgi:hypothetical protein